ncbi:MAG: hypothetical protein KGI38_12260 [Thaumarchaeota archaeon]|nr:hypothetical protein [Nitrososphaerota archaeon]
MQTDEYSLEPVKHERNNRTLTIGEIRKPGTFTSDAVRIASVLNRAKIACTLEYSFLRVGEFTKDGRPKSYTVDILLLDPRFVPTAIEVEGDGSASRDNEKRDAYLATLGLRVLHVDNKTKGEEVIIRLNGSFRKQEGKFP